HARVAEPGHAGGHRAVPELGGPGLAGLRRGQARHEVHLERLLPDHALLPELPRLLRGRRRGDHQQRADERDVERPHGSRLPRLTRGRPWPNLAPGRAPPATPTTTSLEESIA